MKNLTPSEIYAANQALVPILVDKLKLVIAEAYAVHPDANIPEAGASLTPWGIGLSKINYNAGSVSDELTLIFDIEKHLLDFRELNKLVSLAFSSPNSAPNFLDNYFIKAVHLLAIEEGVNEEADAIANAIPPAPKSTSKGKI